VIRDSSVGIATRYGPGIESTWGGWDFPHPSTLAMGPTQPPVQCCHCENMQLPLVREMWVRNVICYVAGVWMTRWQFKVLYRYFLGGTDKNHEILSRDSRRFGRGSKRVTCRLWAGSVTTCADLLVAKCCGSSVERAQALKSKLKSGWGKNLRKSAFH
jgi:hypothetical protein